VVVQNCSAEFIDFALESNLEARSFESKFQTANAGEKRSHTKRLSVLNRFLPNNRCFEKGSSDSTKIGVLENSPPLAIARNIFDLT
jgi:hypothetical protein